ncbi:MAG: N-acetylmuramoyl-L-alanine amidase, partial [Muribaculaceae bacterium]|nr:N-acetylmuramoyl-L-alanine amidase [Muribaculaceae bacterium]
HFIVRLDGRVEAGRPLAEVGAHCSGHNATSIGIAYVGGLDVAGNPRDTRTPAQRRALVELVNELVKEYPQAQVHGHRDFAAKACPCFDATREYAGL